VKKTILLFVSLVAASGCFFPGVSLVSAEILFYPSVEYGAGANPISITSRLFNDDDYLDLAVTNEGSDNVSIFLGVGDGTFETKMDYAVGDVPISLVSGLFDDDAFFDLAVANYADDNVSILLGVGDGTFGAPVEYYTGSNPNYITSGLFNDDVYLDLVTANYNGGSITVLLGDGDGTFTPIADDTSLNAPVFILSGLFNDDALTDLALLNHLNENLFVQLGNGDGTFDPAVEYESGIGAISITSGFFDDDEFLDLAVVNGTDGNVAVFLGVGDGTFAESTYYEVTSARTVTSGDFDNDTFTDLAVSGGNTVAILYGMGDGVFSEPTYNNVNGNNLNAITSGLFNDDDYQDIATANYSSANVSVILGGFDTVGGDEIVVNSLLDDGDGTCTEVKCTFRDAIANSRDGDTIVFDEDVVGTIVLDKNETIDIISYQNFTIEGPGADVLTIDFNDDDNNYFYFQNTGEVNISGLTFTNAPDTVFYNGTETGTYNISDAVFTGNIVYAPVYVYSGNWNFDNVTFSNNASEDYGGAIYFSDGEGDLTITNSTFINNSSIYNSGYGGAVYFYQSDGGGNLTITNSTFDSNTSNGYGGAVYKEGGGLATITNSTFINNSTTDNNDNGYGGAIYIYQGDDTSSITNSTFYNNTSEQGGDAIYADNSEVTIVNSVVSGIDNCVTWETGAITSLGYNIDSGASCGFEEETDLSETDPLLDTALAANGGPVRTLALLEGSPAINAGDDAEAPELDARGYTRLGTSDIGAYEYGGLPPEETCDDEIQNQDETGIDEGGICAPEEPRRRTTSGSSSTYRAKFLAKQALLTPLTVVPPPSNPSPGPGPSSPKVLKLGMTDPEVKLLQIYLNTHNYPVSLTGPGSLNNETNYFGPKTKAAVILFQKANNLTPDGVVGPMTKGVMK
jgi:predicted outer membrane repeat protein